MDSPRYVSILVFPSAALVLRVANIINWAQIGWKAKWKLTYLNDFHSNHDTIFKCATSLIINPGPFGFEKFSLRFVLIGRWTFALLRSALSLYIYIHISRFIFVVWAACAHSNANKKRHSNAKWLGFNWFFSRQQMPVTVSLIHLHIPSPFTRSSREQERERVSRKIK